MTNQNLVAQNFAIATSPDIVEGRIAITVCRRLPDNSIEVVYSDYHPFKDVVGYFTIGVEDTLCYSNDDGDTWYDCPDDIAIVDGLNSGDKFELLVSTRAKRKTFVVTKAPDDSNDEYEVEMEG